MNAELQARVDRAMAFAEVAAEDFASKWRQNFDAKRRLSRSYTNRASSLGDDCERKLVYDRVGDPKDGILHSVELQQIFSLGNEYEVLFKRYAAEAGIEIIRDQKDFSWPEYAITGHIDGEALFRSSDTEFDGEMLPIEIKSMAPHAWAKIRSWQDLHSTWYERYIAQLTVYLMMTESAAGLFIFVNKSTFQPRFLPFPFDVELAATLLQRAERINAHVAQGTLPDQIPWADACDECRWRAVCNPVLVNKGDFRVLGHEVGAAIARIEELRHVAAELRELQEQVKGELVGATFAQAGEWTIKGKEIHVKGRAASTKPVQPYSYWRHVWEKSPAPGPESSCDLEDQHGSE